MILGSDIVQSELRQCKDRSLCTRNRANNKLETHSRLQLEMRVAEANLADIGAHDPVSAIKLAVRPEQKSASLLVHQPPQAVAKAANS